VNVELAVLDDPVAATAEHIAAAARAGGHVGVSGGGTPGPAYTQATRLEPDWSRLQLWWIDERCVPPHHDDSSYRLAEQTLLSRLEVQPAAVHRIQGELEPEKAAALYDAELQGIVLDLAIMGIGRDGHTASLFPGGPELEERERLAVASKPGMDPRVPRVTTTIPFLSLAHLMVYLVTGADKADAVDRAFRRPPSPRTPASLVRGRQTIALLDPAAAGA
jgi:6-phosphogluconolactonase